MLTISGKPEFWKGLPLCTKYEIRGRWWLCPSTGFVRPPWIGLPVDKLISHNEIAGIIKRPRPSQYMKTCKRHQPDSRNMFYLGGRHKNANPHHTSQEEFGHFIIVSLFWYLNCKTDLLSLVTIPFNASPSHISVGEQLYLRRNLLSGVHVSDGLGME
jgi:hypothetical protein